MIQPETSGGADGRGALGAGNDRLIIFVKEPVPGQVKTRLAARIGGEAAARAYRMMVCALIDNLGDPDVGVAVHCGQAGASDRVRDWLAPRMRFPATFREQSAGDLGQRMESAIREHFEEGARRVAIIGSDCPWVGAGDVRAALDALGRADLVLGPAFDGGFYLAAMRVFADGLFDGIPWSTSAVLGRVRGRAADLGLRCELLDRRLHDIDGPSEWEMFQRELNSRRGGDSLTRDEPGGTDSI